MEIGIAALIGGTEVPVGDGETGASRCVIMTNEGAQRAAILKKGTVGQITAECFCALLLRQWGLNVPDPYIVFLPDGIAFASADVAYPSLKQRLSLDSMPQGPQRQAAESMACELAAKFPTTSLAIAVDEVIDNRDRNLGNILWDGHAETWIDHAFSVGEGAFMKDVNKLALMVQITGTYEPILRSSIAQSLTLSLEAVQEAADAVRNRLNADAAAAFVELRLKSLPGRVMARFPQPIDLLSQNDDDAN